MDPVTDPLLLRKSGSAGNRTWDLCICSQKLWPLDHRGDPLLVILEKKITNFSTLRVVVLWWHLRQVLSSCCPKERNTRTLTLQTPVFWNVTSYSPLSRCIICRPNRRAWNLKQIAVCPPKRRQHFSRCLGCHYRHFTAMISSDSKNLIVSVCPHLFWASDLRLGSKWLLFGEHNYWYISIWKYLWFIFKSSEFKPRKDTNHFNGLDF